MSVVGPLSPPRSFAEVWAMIRALSAGLLNLTFAKNFDSFEETVALPANSEVQIRNKFRKPGIPTGYLILDHVGNGTVVRGSEEWTEQWLYLKNVSSVSDATIRVVFFR